MLPSVAGGQNLVINDTLVLLNLGLLDKSKAPLLQYCFSQDLEYWFTASDLLLINWQHGDDRTQVSLLQNLKYRSRFNNSRNFTISTSFVHLLGLQFFFDSLTCFQPDENTLDTRIDLRIRKNLTFNILANFSTRLFNSYQYSSGQSGKVIKTLNSSFLTPLLCTFSAGFGLIVPKLGRLNLGVSAAKLTVVSNKNIYEELGVTDFYGVPKNRNHAFEYGLSMQILLDKDVFKRVHWNCDVLIFKNYRKPVDLVMKSIIGIKITKYLRTSIQTRVFYEQEMSKSIQFENLVSLGLYFCL
jgi:hypothetical protein